jgi:hypothetical protein
MVIGELVVSFKDPVLSGIVIFFLGFEILELRAMICVAEHHVHDFDVSLF